MKRGAPKAQNKNEKNRDHVGMFLEALNAEVAYDEFKRLETRVARLEAAARR